jgi:outer membrane protein W
VDIGTYLSDLDVVEQYHNFVLHSTIQPYAGVDLTAFFLDEFTTKHITTKELIKPFGSNGFVAGWGSKCLLIMLGRQLYRQRE